MSKKLTYEFVKNYVESFEGYILLSKEYISTSTKLDIQCPKGHIFQMHYNNFKQGKRCAKCSNIKKYSYQEVKNIIEIESNSGCKLISKEYTNNITKLDILCFCGNEFKTDLVHFLYQNKQHCDNCGGVNRSKKRKYKYIHIKEQVKNRGINLLTTENEYKSIHQKLVGELDGYIITFLYNNIVNKNCEPETFFINNPYTINNINLWLVKNNKSFILLSKAFKNAKATLLWKCNKCNNEWNVCWDSILSGTECPQCSSSKGEKKITSWLNRNNIDFIPQKTFNNLIGVGNGLLSYDFYIPKFDTCIEFNGIQHYEVIDYFGGKKQFIIQQEHDKRKRDYCNTNNIKLLEIPYWDFDNVEDILNKELMFN